MSDIASIIDKDSGLTARLLRLANSAYYGFSNEIDSVKRALVCIGTREIQNLVLCTSIINLFRGIPEKLINMRSFWQHSIACGITAKCMSTYVQAVNPDHLFIAGLLHDIGRLLICKYMPNKASQILGRNRQNHELCHRVEKDVLGYDHSEVAHILLTKWNIPRNIREGVSFHHNPLKAERYANNAAIVHLSDIIVHSMQLGNSGEAFVPSLEPKAWEAIRLKASMLSSIMHQMRIRYDEVTNDILLEH